MAEVIITQDRVILMAQPDGPGTALEPLSVDRHGFGDFSIPKSGREAVPGRNVDGTPRNKLLRVTPPGGSPTGQIDFDKIVTPDFLDQVSKTGRPFGVWVFYVEFGVLTNLSGWGRLDFYGGLAVTSETHGAQASRTNEGNIVPVTLDVTGLFHVAWVPWDISALTITEDQDITAIAGLKELDIKLK